jgi:hypothetical protein
MSDNIPFDAQEMPWGLTFDYDLGQWIDPDLPSPTVDWMDLVDWNADQPDAVGSCNAGPIR